MAEPTDEPFFIGCRDGLHGPVFVYGPDSRPLRPRPDLLGPSANEFEWGYDGCGPSALALAILAEAGNGESAVKHYRAYMRDVIAKLPHAGWRITLGSVFDWFAEQLVRESIPTVRLYNGDE